MALKRANGEGSLRKRSNGTWEARITVGTDPMTGKLISKSVYGRTQKDCRQKLKALQDKLEGRSSKTAAFVENAAAELEAEKEMTVGEWLDIWLAEYLADVKPGTQDSYQSVCRLYLKPAFGEVPLNSLRAPMIQKMYNQLKEKGLSPKYIKNIHGVLHRALDMAVRLEYLLRNPTCACVIPRVVEKKVEPLDAPDQKKLFEVLRGEEFEALFLTDVFTGMRCGELIGLTWDCVDFEHGVIHVEKQLCQAREKGKQVLLRDAEKRKDPDHRTSSLRDGSAEAAPRRSGKAEKARRRSLERRQIPQPGVHPCGRQPPEPVVCLPDLPELSGEGGAAAPPDA